MGVGEFSPFSDPVPYPSSWIGQGASLFCLLFLLWSGQLPLLSHWLAHSPGTGQVLRVGCTYLIVFPQNITSGLLQSAGV